MYLYEWDISILATFQNMMFVIIKACISPAANDTLVLIPDCQHQTGQACLPVSKIRALIFTRLKLPGRNVNDLKGIAAQSDADLWTPLSSTSNCHFPMDSFVI